MKALKLGLVVSLVALFFVACGTDAPNNNANPSANHNGTSSPTVAPPTTSSGATGNSGATANSNTPGGPGSGSGNAPAPATNANVAATGTAANSNAKGGAAPASNVDAAALFAANKCTGCHGADGKGNPNIKDVPNFTDAAWQKKTTDAEMIKTIANGDKPMPAYKDKLSEEQIKALVAYVRSFAK
ncbi:MAG TPA: c-type cytochrome [Blastocatellia bacterium]|jgi:mono/diheme cytochrome c family protein|nr:c-type cytochrome [Blastocatellia bacterium]